MQINKVYLMLVFVHLDFIATTDVNSPVLTPKPTEYDVHVYQTPSMHAVQIRCVDILRTNQLGSRRIRSSMMALLCVVNQYREESTKHIQRDGTHYFEVS